MQTINHGHKVTGDESWLSYLAEAAPDVLWFHLESHGDWQGEVFAVGKYQGKCLIFKGWYGSCSGCGAWGEGGVPTCLKDVLDCAKVFDDRAEAEAYWETGDVGKEAIGAILGD